MTFECVFVYDAAGAVGIIMTSPDGKGFEAFTIETLHYLGCRSTKGEAATLVLDGTMTFPLGDQ